MQFFWYLLCFSHSCLDAQQVCVPVERNFSGISYVMASEITHMPAFCESLSVTECSGCVISSQRGNTPKGKIRVPADHLHTQSQR